MKTTLYVTILALVVFGLASVWAAPMVESWIQPLTSKAAMRSYLVERSVRGFVDTYGEGVLDQSLDSLSFLGSNAEELCRLISSQSITIKVVVGRENDVCQTVQLYDQNGNATFLSWKKLNLIAGDGGLAVTNPEVKLSMADRVSVEVPPGLSSAYVKTRDENGNFVGGTDCPIIELNGHLYLNFPVSALGDAFAPGYYGELMVQRQVGEEYATDQYDLGTGLMATTCNVSMMVKPSIEGVKFIDLNQPYEMVQTIESSGNVGLNTMFVLTITEELGDGFLVAQTSEGEVPTGCYIKFPNWEGDGHYTQYFSTGYVPVGILPVGTYHAWFTWSKFHEAGERAEGWDDYGYGKGK